jgi:para-nitrobenzyl esterase
MARYPLSRFPGSSPFIASRTVKADAVNVCPALVTEQRLARHIPVYAFQNDNADTPRLDPSLPLGAFHNAENPFLFPNSNLKLNANQAALGAADRRPMGRRRPYRQPHRQGRSPLDPLQQQAPARDVAVPAGASAVTPAQTSSRQHNCGFWSSVNRNAPWVPRT